MTIDQTSLLDEIAERVERMERMCTDMAAMLGAAVPCPMHEPDDPDCSPMHGGACRPPRTHSAEPPPMTGIDWRDRPHTLEAARWICKGDVIQAVHGDTWWAEVLHQPVRTADMTGLVTRGPRGERMRWWAHTDMIRVETPAVPDPTPFRR